MSLARSKITAQGQVSVPAKVRQKLGVGPGSILIWEEEKGKVMIRRAGGYTSEDIHTAVFVDGSRKRKSLGELKKGVRKHIRKKHERG